MKMHKDLRNICTFVVVYNDMLGDTGVFNIVRHMNIHGYNHSFFIFYALIYCCAYVCMAIGNVGYSCVYLYARQ